MSSVFVCDTFTADAKKESCSRMAVLTAFPVHVRYFSALWKYGNIGGLRIRGYDSLRLKLITERGGRCIHSFSILGSLHPLNGKCLEESVGVGLHKKHVCMSRGRLKGQKTKQR